MINSKQKGKRGELLLVKELNGYGYDTRRTNQYCGNTGLASDLVGLPKVHIECKNQERLNIYDAVDQSRNDAREGEIPCVFHKKNRKGWLVTMPLNEWVKLYEAYLKS